ncbi:MAG: SIR2 family NAD-dependent protein deacylase [Candidatus Heimdallarchaeaceae archaeon]
MKKRYLEVKARFIAEKILQAKHFIALTGAGISTESGIPDYRGDNGIYKSKAQGKEVKVKPLEEFEPNPAHYALVRLQDLGLLKFIISQNIDGLHIKSGIKESLIAEIHGNYSILKCIECDSRFTKKEMNWDNEKYGWGARNAEPSPEQPNCLNCGGRLISSIVNFGEPMPEKEMKLAKEHSKRCDLMLVIGTSLRVAPANTLPRIAEKNGAEVFIINLKPTGLDNILKNERIKAKAGEILPLIVNYREESIEKDSKT